MKEQIGGIPSMPASAEVGVFKPDWVKHPNDEVLSELTAGEIEEFDTLRTTAIVSAIQLGGKRLYYPGNADQYTQYNDLMVKIRYGMTRIEELVSGYPQTGSAASIAATRILSSPEPNPRFQLQRSIRYFSDFPAGVWKAEKAAFGDGALTFEQIKYYTHRDPAQNTESSPIVVGHTMRGDEAQDAMKLYSYMLVLREANPEGKTAFERHLPPGADYLDGIWTHPGFRQEHLASELVNELLGSADRPVYFSTKASNFSMWHLAARMGEDRCDPNYQEGPNAGRSRAIELLYWPEYFGRVPNSGRVMTLYDPGIFIPKSIATIQEGDWTEVHEVEKCIREERMRIAINNGPTYNSAFHPVTRRVDMAVASLLNSGYIGIPLGKHRLYVRPESLPLRAERIIGRRHGEVDIIRQKDLAGVW